MINEGEECGDCESTYVILVKCGVDFPWESLVVLLLLAKVKGSRLHPQCSFLKRNHHILQYKRNVASLTG